MLAEALNQHGQERADQRLPRLLILRCASTKRPGAAPMPAIERYDGPAFRVLRKYLRSNPSDPPLVRVVSAEHGLMTLEQPISEYDRRMDAERAVESRQTVLAAVAALVREQPVREVLVVVGKTYLLALTGIEQVLDGVPVRIAGETQGRKLGVLRAWLYGRDGDKAVPRPASEPRQLALVPSAEMTFTVGGKQFTTSADQVRNIARQALSSGDKRATRITRWYVPVDGGRVSPKWLVSQVSGAATSDFQANAARSMLERLGIETLETDSDDAPE